MSLRDTLRRIIQTAQFLTVLQTRSARWEKEICRYFVFSHLYLKTPTKMKTSHSLYLLVHRHNEFKGRSIITKTRRCLENPAKCFFKTFRAPWPSWKKPPCNDFAILAIFSAEVRKYVVPWHVHSPQMPFYNEKWRRGSIRKLKLGFLWKKDSSKGCSQFLASLAVIFVRLTIHQAEEVLTRTSAPPKSLGRRAF